MTNVRKTAAEKGEARIVRATSRPHDSAKFPNVAAAFSFISAVEGPVTTDTDADPSSFQAAAAAAAADAAAAIAAVSAGPHPP